MKRFRIFIFILSALCCQFIVKANGDKKVPGDSILQGNLLDANTKKPIGDVIVSLTSGKQQKKKELKSDASGFFYFPQLPPGEFTLQFEKKGYKTSRKDLVMTKEGIQLNLSLESEDEDSDVDTWNPLRVIYGK